jgi:hypothetical protein
MLRQRPRPLLKSLATERCSWKQGSQLEDTKEWLLPCVQDTQIPSLPALLGYYRNAEPDLSAILQGIKPPEWNVDLSPLGSMYAICVHQGT